jgi:uncharacterized protein involved in exopolysaccharide biosynthesis
MDAKSRESRAQAHGAIDSREADNNALIQNLKSDITRAESRLDYTSRFFTKDHPRYQASEAEVLKLRAELNKQLRTTSNSLTNEAVVIEKRVAEIRNALEVQKIKVQDLNRARNEFAVLTKEVENAQNAYSSATQRFSQTKLEGQSLQSDIAVLDSAISVRSEILPRLIKMLLMSTFAGLFLGLGYAVAAEWRDRRVRSLADFAHISDLSALGVMEMQMSTQPRFRLAGIVPFRPQLPK